ncbi:MAG: rhomboid family intramembrane serine protease [Nannocystaceae bacterium]
MARARSFAALPRFGRIPLGYALGLAILNMLVADQPYAAQLTLGPGFVEAQAYWQPLTALFLYPAGRLDGLIGTFLIQWVIGTPVAERLGAARYLALLVGAGLVGTLSVALLGFAVPSALAVPLGGSLPGDLAAVVAFGVFFGRRHLNLFGVLPFTARTLALLIAGLALVAPLLRGGHWAVALVHAAAMLTALLVTARPWRRGGGSGKVGGRGKGGKAKAKHLRVVH